MTTERCRLVLIAPDMPDAAERAKVLADALKGGDVASVIVPQYGLDDSEFQKHAERLVPAFAADLYPLEVSADVFSWDPI